MEFVARLANEKAPGMVAHALGDGRYAVKGQVANESVRREVQSGIQQAFTLARGFEDTSTFFNLAVAYKNLGRLDDSRQALASAAKLDPSYSLYSVDEPPRPASDAGVDASP